jgi:predicted O-linked N-acetylglucosamine transferase (SPINDLY family)
LHTSGRLDEAAKLYTEILSQLPRDFDATHLLGVVALQQGRYDTAQRLINAAVAINPHDVAAVGNLGTSYMRDGKLVPALQWFEIALKLQPDAVNALVNAATALHNMGRYADAIPLLRKAYLTDSSSYEACNLLGACLVRAGEIPEAAKMFEAATRSRPGDADAWANLSMVLNAIGQSARARECADRAGSLKPQRAGASGALAEAIESFRLGNSAPAPSVPMLIENANALMANGLYEDAVEQLRRALTLDEDNLTVRWAIAMGQIKAIYKSETGVTASRRALAKHMDEVAAWYRQSGGVREPFNVVGTVQPFYLAYQPFNNRELLERYGAICAAWMATLPAHASAAKPTHAPAAGGRKLRVGFASAQICEHSIWNAVTKGWVDNIDRTKFEVCLFQLSRKSDQETEHARSLVAHFEDRPTTLTEWVDAIAARDLDVLVYPDIGLDPLTVRLACLRLAPVQATSWGHPETSGLPTMDLYLSAEALEPEGSSANYSETLVRLPNLGVYVEPRNPASVTLDLKSLNLPDDEPLLLCPGAPFKYSPFDDDVLVQIAKGLRRRLFRRNSGGRLVFFRSHNETLDRILEHRLRAAFEKGGVQFDQRVSIIPFLDSSRYHGLMRQSALMLDTLGFSGFNTALQAIECDLPVVAFEGEFMRGRLASGVMRRLDLPELVAATKQDFIDKAVKLAADPGRRDKLRGEIRRRRGVLFNDMAPVHALERRLTEAVVAAAAIREEAGK